MTERTREELERQLERANRIIGWMMPYVGSMCPPSNGLYDLNLHCCENRVPEPGEETKGPSIKQHADGARPSGVMPAVPQKEPARPTPAQRRYLRLHLKPPAKNGELRRQDAGYPTYDFVSRMRNAGFIDILDPDQRFPYSWYGTRITAAGREVII